MSNLSSSTSRVKRQSKFVSPEVPTLIWATLEQDRMKWRGVQMDEDLRSRIVQAAKEAISEKFDLSVLDRYLEAA
jgi:hypothetical protein